ncbi:MAG TPA: glucose-6-phosphate isomerase, partial [Candidatus Dormibacteraeota bacterium]
YIISSKSGSTTEPNAFFAYFWEKVRALKGDRAGENFIAITDPNTAMGRTAAAHSFRRTFANPPEIGGRYSALSYFGMVPAALMGIDVAELLDRATRMSKACSGIIPAEHNPGLVLGAAIGALARQGRDKLTYVVSPQVGTFGYWTEQLIAESTGKEGTGIVPVEGESVGSPKAYSGERDRLFAYVRLGSKHDRAVAALERAGHPVIEIRLEDAYDLGGEFMRWEVATAAAGWVLGIDPFDQPNVQESKDNTKKVLATYKSRGKLPAVDTVAAAKAKAGIASLLKQAKRGAYFAIMAYTARTPQSEASIAAIRAAVRDKTRIATTAGYGPRFLHSTGQLHKGGPKTGLFLQVVQEDARDVPVPGQPFTFSVLKQSQAIGDMHSLTSRRLPVLRVTLGREPAAGWRALAMAVKQAVK